MRISVTIITKNEEVSISRCIESVRWADEVVVVDSGSTDRTTEICRELGAKVMVTGDWPGFGPQKNRALAQATGDWVLSLDADEWVTADLRDEILNVISNPDGATAFRAPRLSSFCGRFMRHSGWRPDYVTRLFRRGAAGFSDDVVHERVIVEGKTGTLREPIMHETFVDLDELLQKMNRYSSLAAQEMRHGGKKAGLAGAVLRGLWAFIRTYFLRGGYRDGREGFMLAVATAEGTYYRYAKLMLLEKK
ncbi:MAG TPA: glycosyltransferase family 2 protein [Burkholderiales bacterium]|jgi:glycosyltransferase involved in cell wall biosynthesis|nr:glycosyltransferase family 2 protein [Burkholderiales bacterium]